MTARLATVDQAGAVWRLTLSDQVYPMACFTTESAALKWARANGYRVDQGEAPARESIGAFYKRVAIWAAVGIPAFWLVCGLLG